MSIRKMILSVVALTLILCQGCFSPKGNLTMELTLDVPVGNILMSLSGQNHDSTFVSALARAKELQIQSQSDFTTLFGQAFQQADPHANLSTIYATYELRDRISLSSTNREVLSVLQDEVTKTIDSCAEVMRARLVRYGISQKATEVQCDGNRINVKLSGIDNPERIRRLLINKGRLEFWETYECAEIISYLAEANELLKTSLVNEPEELSETSAPETETGVSSLLDQIEKDTVIISDDELARENPLFIILHPNLKNDGEAFPGSMVGIANSKDTAMVNAYLKIPQITSRFPRDMKLLWSFNPYKWEDSKTLYELHAIKVTTRDGKAPLDGSIITSAKSDSRYRGSEVTTLLSMNDEGARLWRMMTRDNLNRNIAVVKDGYVLSSPRVLNEITGGETEISGDLTIEESEDLANTLSSGALPCEVNIVNEVIVKNN